MDGALRRAGNGAGNKLLLVLLNRRLTVVSFILLQAVHLHLSHNALM